MWLAEGTSAYRAAYDDRFGDDDSDNPIIIERCIVNAEESMFEAIGGFVEDEFDFAAFIKNFNKLYNSVIDAFIDKNYWKEHAKYYDYVLW